MIDITLWVISYNFISYSYSYNSIELYYDIIYKCINFGLKMVLFIAHTICTRFGVFIKTVVFVLKMVYL